MGEFDSDFNTCYKRVHGPLAMSVSLVGVVANIVNILVLTRPHMRHNATNVLLCGLSASQLLLLLNYIPFTVYTHFLDGMCTVATKTHSWLLYLLINANMNVVWHTVAVVHTCLLALFRYVSIHWPHRQFANETNAIRAAIATYLLLPILCSPFYFNSKIVENWDFVNHSYCNVTVTNKLYQLSYSDNTALFMYNFWFVGIFCKIVPCVSLAVLSFLLIRDIKKAEKRKRLLKGAVGLPLVANTNTKGRRAESSQRSRISQMLLAIVCLFMLVEFPQGLMNVFVAFQITAVQRIYFNLGDFFEMLTILYSSVNFVLYCGMSSQFRATFRTLFPCACLLSTTSTTSPTTTNPTTASRKNTALFSLNGTVMTEPRASVTRWLLTKSHKTKRRSQSTATAIDSYRELQAPPDDGELVLLTDTTAHTRAAHNIDQRGTLISDDCDNKAIMITYTGPEADL